MILFVKVVVLICLTFRVVTEDVSSEFEDNDVSWNNELVGVERSYYVSDYVDADDEEKEPIRNQGEEGGAKEEDHSSALQEEDEAEDYDEVDSPYNRLDFDDEYFDEEEARSEEEEDDHVDPADAEDDDSALEDEADDYEELGSAANSLDSDYYHDEDREVPTNERVDAVSSGQHGAALVSEIEEEEEDGADHANEDEAEEEGAQPEDEDKDEVAEEVKEEDKDEDDGARNDVSTGKNERAAHEENEAAEIGDKLVGRLRTLEANLQNPKASIKRPEEANLQKPKASIKRPEEASFQKPKASMKRPEEEGEKLMRQLEALEAKARPSLKVSATKAPQVRGLADKALADEIKLLEENQDRDFDIDDPTKATEPVKSRG